MNPSLRAGRVLVVLLLVSACGRASPGQEQDCSAVACSPCAPALVLRILVPTGASTPDVALGSGQGGCSSTGASLFCTPAQRGVGHYALDVQAPGYKSVHLEQDVAAVQGQGCCACGYEPRVVDVSLEPG